MLYNETLDTNSSSDNKISKSCVGQGCLLYWLYNKKTTVGC